MPTSITSRGGKMRAISLHGEINAGPLWPAIGLVAALLIAALTYGSAIYELF
jgi:hypothetical protein